MAKQPAKNLDLTVNSIVLEDDMDSFNLNITQEAPVTTSFADAGPRRVTGNYDWDMDIAGAGDFAASQSDASVFATVGAAPFTVTVEPTGTAAGTDTPTYTGSVVLTSYSISAALGAPVKYSAGYAGATALTRNVV